MWSEWKCDIFKEMAVYKQGDSIWPSFKECYSINFIRAGTLDRSESIITGNLAL